MNFKITKNIADLNPDIKIYLNYPPKNPKYEEQHPEIKFDNPYAKRFYYCITPAHLLTLRLPNEHDGLVCIDELWKWLQARGSGGAEINKVIGVIVFEGGKRGFDINWDSQLGSSIDKWVRLLTPRFYFSKTPSAKYFRYGYVSETYHAGKKVIKLKMSKAIAEARYYPYFNTMFSPDWARLDEEDEDGNIIKGNVPSMKDIRKANTNELNDLSQEFNPPQDVSPEVERKDNEELSNFLEEQKSLEKELTGKEIIDGTDLMNQIEGVRKDVIEEGEPLP